MTRMQGVLSSIASSSSSADGGSLGSAGQGGSGAAGGDGGSASSDGDTNYALLDPYVALDVDELSIERTSTKSKTRDPTWNETFTTDLLRNANEAGFTVWHDATMPPDDAAAAAWPNADLLLCPRAGTRCGQAFGHCDRHSLGQHG